MKPGLRHITGLLLLLVLPTLGKTQDAQGIHQRLLVLDTHVDTPSVILETPDFDFAARHDALADLSQVDLPRMVAGGLDAAFFAVYVPQGPRTEAGRLAHVQRAEQLFAIIHQLVADHPQQLALATSPDEVRRLVTSHHHAILIGIENGAAIGGDLERLRRFWTMGARYMTLTHSANNELADSSTDPNGPEHHGLSALGEQVVSEMNQLGMMVDISHTADETFWDALHLSKAPIIASHSGCFALYPHPRNMKDDMIRALAQAGGVIQINTYASYMADIPQDPQRLAALAALQQAHGDPDTLDAAGMAAWRMAYGEINKQFPPRLPPLSLVADHIDHAVAIAGIDHVGLGADFDGGGGVAGLYDASELPNLTAELLRRGYSRSDLRKFWGGNLLRVMGEAQRLAAKAPQGAPLASASSSALPSR